MKPGFNWLGLESDVSDVLSDCFAEVSACGSRVTCDPAPTDTDRDFLVYMPVTGLAELSDELSRLGFTCESQPNYANPKGNDGFKSWRRGDINLIVTCSSDFTERHKAATYVCTLLNIADKSHRIVLFQAVLYGRAWVPSLFKSLS